jgi:hypothetical protein
LLGTCTQSRSALVALPTLLLLACGGSIEPATMTTTSDATSSDGADASSVGDAAVTDATSTAIPDVADASSIDCKALEEAIASLASGAACTSVVRLSYTSRTPLGWQILCGPRAPISAADAKPLGKPYVSTYSALDVYKLVSPPGAAGQWIYEAAAGDFGGVFSIGAQTSMTTFAATTVWAGAGDIEYPTLWRSPAELGSHCSATRIPAGRTTVGSLASPDDISNVMSVLTSTALPAGLGRVHNVNETLIYRYFRTVGVDNPDTAEWIVLVDSAAK